MRQMLRSGTGRAGKLGGGELVSPCHGVGFIPGAAESSTYGALMLFSVLYIQFVHTFIVTYVSVSSMLVIRSLELSLTIFAFIWHRGLPIRFIRQI